MYANQLPGLPTLDEGFQQGQQQQANQLAAERKRQALARQLLGQNGMGGPIDSFGEMAGSLIGSAIEGRRNYLDNQAQKALGGNLPGVRSGKIGGLF